MGELILKVILAHLLGDFVFQTQTMVDGIENKKIKSKYLYLHVLIHLTLLLTLTGFEKQYIFPAILLSISHLVIDILTKIILKNKINHLINFLLDQLLHFSTIAVFINYFHEYNIAYKSIFNPENYLLIIALVGITFFSSVVIKKIMEIFNYPLPNDGIEDAGKYIGMLERLFIFTFIITDFWEGIGFLLAAKSIFRFGDLKEHKEIKLTEYILIGTLISFGLAMLIGQIYLKTKNLL